MRSLLYTRFRVFIPHTKTGHFRYVPISNRLLNVLENLGMHKGTDYLFAGVPKIGNRISPKCGQCASRLDGNPGTWSQNGRKNRNWAKGKTRK
jgi:hypothetical protein